MIESLRITLPLFSYPHRCEHGAEHRHHRVDKDDIVYYLSTDTVINDDELCDGEEGRNDEIRDGNA